MHIFTPIEKCPKKFQGWVLSVQNRFWTGQWTKPGFNRLKPDKTGQNLIETVNHCSGYETVQDGKRARTMNGFSC